MQPRLDPRIPDQRRLLLGGARASRAEPAGVQSRGAGAGAGRQLVGLRMGGGQSRHRAAARGPGCAALWACAGGQQPDGQSLPSLAPAGQGHQQGEDVAATGITALEVHGLKYGIDDFRDKYKVKDRDVPSDERNKTDESPSHMAVVLVANAPLDPGKPVHVILHFHGWGFRTFDPFAGYLITKGPDPRADTVRDVDQEHWEQQISTRKGQGAHVVAILAQSRGKSDFGSFPTFDYVRDRTCSSSLTARTSPNSPRREIHDRPPRPQRWREYEAAPTDCSG